MQLILFSILVIGLSFVFRTQQKSADRALIPKHHLTKIGTATICCAILITFYIKPVLVCALLIALFMLHWLIIKVFEHRSLERLRSLVPSFLDAWVLNLRMGFSATHACDRALKETDPAFAKLTKTYLESKIQGHSSVLFDHVIQKELKEILLTPHSALKRVEFLRNYQKRSADFRRRSGQAVRQARIQSSVMLFLLLALSGLTLSQRTWSETGDLIGMAVTLGTVGLILMEWLARKRKWNI